MLDLLGNHIVGFPHEAAQFSCYIASLKCRTFGVQNKSADFVDQSMGK